MASPRKSSRLISSRGHGCFTISPPQLPATATRFPSYGSGRPGLVLRTATKLSSVGFESTGVLTFGLRVRRLNHSATRSIDTLVWTLAFQGNRHQIRSPLLLEVCSFDPKISRSLQILVKEQIFDIASVFLSKLWRYKDLNS